MEQNIFGGKNPLGVYTPLTDVELEVLYKLAADNAYVLNIKDWGYVDKFKNITIGDSIISFTFQLSFVAPEIHIPVYYFDFTLATIYGDILISKKEAFPEPLMLGSGVSFDFCWDIQLINLSPEFVKRMKPGAHGLTTREGNWKFNELQKQTMDMLKQGRDKIKKIENTEIEIAKRKQDKAYNK